MYNSSKIRAAVEVLQSLAKPQDHRLKTSDCSEGSSNLHSGNSPNGFPDEKDLVTGESLNDSCKVLGEKAIVFSSGQGCWIYLKSVLKVLPSNMEDLMELCQLLLEIKQ